jgi:hypothetical protein
LNFLKTELVLKRFFGMKSTITGMFLFALYLLYFKEKVDPLPKPQRGIRIEFEYLGEIEVISK